MELLTDPQAWTAFLTLTVLEIVLGIDNIVFISILTDRLPHNQRDRARVVGLGAAMIMRILLLFAISWIIGLTEPWFELFGREFSGRDLILLTGGLFLLYKATTEIHAKLEGEEHDEGTAAAASFAAVIAQIMMLDIVFSLDSVITAVGMADDIEVMIAAVVVAVGVMLWASGPLANFVQEHPTIKILALSFLILIGMSLVAEGFHQHIPKGYIYAAMTFSVIVELINLRVRATEEKEAEPVHLKRSYAGEKAVGRAARGRTARGAGD
ncbi:MAG TPA: TerC family protein [Thermomicrobiales bacterium]|nr:TerC family protein [Thermomicrobiales bacterium]